MPASVSKSRDVDSVLLRLPASLKLLASSIAHTNNVSQNALYATSVFTAAIMLGAANKLGSPDNLLQIIDQIDAALDDGFPVIGYFHKADWDDVSPFITMLSDLDVLGDMRSKADISRGDTVVYTFSVQKVGHALWTSISEVMRARLIRDNKKGGFDDSVRI